MKWKNYKILRVRVYPLPETIGLAKIEDIIKLVNYYRNLGFVDVDKNISNEPFEMIYNIISLLDENLLNKDAYESNKESNMR